MGFATSRFLAVLAASAVTFPFTRCQGVPSTSNTQPVSVALNQTSGSVAAGSTLQFSVTVAGTTNTAVTWSVDSVAGGNATTGAINVSGMYTAPAAAGSHTVTATSVVDTTKSASATVTVTSAGTNSISPVSVSLAEGAKQQFSVNFPGVSSSAIGWSVDSINGGSSTVGTITVTGLYTAPSQVGTHTVTAASTDGTAISASAQVAVFAMSISPSTATVAPSGTKQFNATGASNSSVTWSVDGVANGNSSVGTITASGLYTAPFVLGPHTITAISSTNSSFTASADLTVVNSSPGAVLTYHNDDARDGAFTEETTLTPANVNSTQFGKRFSYAVDGQIYTQPLYIPKLSIGGSPHNVVFIATENDTVYAFDADGLQSTPLWSKSLGIPVPKNDEEGVTPVLGITSTPVIDITTNTIYVLAETPNGPFNLHALDITSGAEKFGGPITVSGSVSGTGTGNVGGKISLEPE
jgi:hypothetical protein